MSLYGFANITIKFRKLFISKDFKVCVNNKITSKNTQNSNIVRYFNEIRFLHDTGEESDVMVIARIASWPTHVTAE